MLDSGPNNLLAAPMHTIRIFIMAGAAGGEGGGSICPETKMLSFGPDIFNFSLLVVFVNCEFNIPNVMTLLGQYFTPELPPLEVGPPPPGAVENPLME